MATTKTLDLEKLTPTVGAEVRDVDVDRLLADDDLPGAVLEALEANGVLLFRELHVDDAAQAAFCHRLGEVRLWPDTEVPEIFEISKRPENPYAKVTEGTVNWHIDGLIDQDIPTKATILSAKVVSTEGGETEFASTYAAFDDLSDEERDRYAKLRVRHSFVAARRPLYPNPTPQQMADWEARGGREHPLVWTHGTGRRSLVLGSSADYVVGMDVDEGRALLDELLGRTTAPERVYRHTWSVGDLLMWDNTGVVHRAIPYDESSGRRMHRCTIMGDERIQ
jgi:alpha-ketoglutarate-dependent taurine dioxygenase